MRGLIGQRWGGGGYVMIMRWWILRLCVLAAAAVSGLLLFQSWAGGAAPGCSAGGGCGAVLGSRWATVLGVPVSLPALLTHGLIFALSGSAAARERRRLLGAAAVAVAGSALWFIGLQVWGVGAFCPWCMAAHTLGLVAAALILFPRPSWPPAAAAWGGLAVAGLIAAQTLYEPPVPDLTPDNFAGFTGLQPADYPRLGLADAPVAVAYLYDINCPVCRFAHAHLTAARARYGDQLVVVLMPAPFSDRCNPHMSRTSEAFATSCELTELLMAVHHADPSAVEAFDAFLFADPAPSVAAARARAAKLVGEDALTTALANPAVEAAVASNVPLFDFLGRSVPRMIIGGRAYPAVTTEEGFFELLERATGLAGGSPDASER